MQSTIFIHQLVVDTIIGTHTWEQNTKQPIILDLALQTDISQAAASDNLQHAIDYQLLADQLTTFIANNNFKLIETLSHACIEFILNNFPGINTITLTLKKPKALANAECAGITIERTRA